MTVKLAEQHSVFLSLKGGCTGWSESTFVKLPHCWKSHVVAHIALHLGLYYFAIIHIRPSAECKVISCYHLSLSITKLAN